MNSAEHVAQAIIHLEQATTASHDHLLLERRLSEWQQAVLVSARASAAKQLLTEVHAVWNPPEETWAVPDFGHLRDLNGCNLFHDE